MSTFHKVISTYEGKPSTLNIFLNRCDNFHTTLNIPGRKEFLANIIYKLDDTAHIIYKTKHYTDWKQLRKDLVAGIAEQKSLPTLQTEMLALKQRTYQSVGEFADVIRKKLNTLTEKVKELSDSPIVQQTLNQQIDQISCRALKEGVHEAMRNRLISSKETTFEKLRQFALEEEPYVLQSVEHSDYYQNYSNSFYRNNSNIQNQQQEIQQNRRQFFNSPQQNQNSWRSNPTYNSFNRNNYNYSNTNDRFHNNNENNQQNTPNLQYQNEQYRYHNGYEQRNSNNVQQFPNSVSTVITCYSCGKPGHMQRNCFVRMNDNQSETNNMNPTEFSHLRNPLNTKNDKMDGQFGNPVRS